MLAPVGNSTLPEFVWQGKSNQTFTFINTNTRPNNTTIPNGQVQGSGSKISMSSSFDFYVIFDSMHLNYVNQSPPALIYYSNITYLIYGAFLSTQNISSTLITSPFNATDPFGTSLTTPYINTLGIIYRKINNASTTDVVSPSGGMTQGFFTKGI